MKTNTTGSERPTTKAVRMCAEWLVQCLEFGWSRDDLLELEKVWWKFKDNRGNLKQGKN